VVTEWGFRVLRYGVYKVGLGARASHNLGMGHMTNRSIDGVFRTLVGTVS